MNKENIEILQESIKSKQIKSSIKESREKIRDLISLEYSLRVVDLINHLDEIINDLKYDTNNMQIFIKKIEATEIQFLSCNVLLDGKESVLMQKKIVGLIDNFYDDSVKQCYQEDFLIYVEMKNYNKDKLSDEIIKGMLSKDLQVAMNFVNLNNDISKKNEINVKRNKI